MDYIMDCFLNMVAMSENYKNENILFKIDNSPYLVPVELDFEYKKKWNIHPSEQFYHIVKDDKILNNGALYRKGGMYLKNSVNPYQLLLKQVESFYDDEITKIVKDKPYLSGHWVIIDQKGNEKVEFEKFKSPYLVKGSCIYDIDNEYYNIETGEYYGYHSGSYLESTDFIFINTKYDFKEKDKTKKGVKKINKKDGSVEIFE